MRTRSNRNFRAAFFTVENTTRSWEWACELVAESRVRGVMNQTFEARKLGAFTQITP